jgi:hypothetical protein
VKVGMYVVYDIEMEQSWNIGFAKTDAVALREFQKICKEKEELAPILKLYHVGQYDHDDMSGVFVSPREVVPTVSMEVEE